MSPAKKAAVVRSIPELGKPKRPRAIRPSAEVLDSGLKLTAIRKAGVPLVEIRLRVPLAGASRDHIARTTVLAETMLKGTREHSALDFEQEVGLLGATLSVSVDHDKLAVGGSVLASNLGPYLGLLAEALTSATYPTDEVDSERQRLVEHLSVANSQAGVLASKARAAALFGDHAYGIAMPEAADLDVATAPSLRALHRRRVAPQGALLVLVGDVQPAKAIALAQTHLASWTGTASARRVGKVPSHSTGPLILVDRPGSVQSAIRVGCVALQRTDPDYAAQQVANMVFGGNFSSRLTRNLREDKGYTYSPGSGVEQRTLAAIFAIAADVATDVTAASIVEITYELSRMVTTLAKQDEIENARQYLIGAQSLSLSSQSGLASMVANLEYAGLSLDWLREHHALLATTTAEDVLRAAGRMLQPMQMRTAVVGDADQIETQLHSIATLERQ